MTRRQAIRPRRVAWLLSAAGLVGLLAGCGGGRVKLRPVYDEGLQRPVDDGRAAVIQQGGVSLTLRDSKVDLGDEDLFAVEIEMINETDQPLSLRLDDVVLIDHFSREHHPVDPRVVERCLTLADASESQDRSAEVITQLWRDPVIPPGRRQAGLIVFRLPLVKRQLFHFELTVRPPEELPADSPVSTPPTGVRFEFLFYST